jgi:hypothetical protein
LYAKFYAKNDAGRDFWTLHRNFLDLPESFGKEVLKRVGEGELSGTQPVETRRRIANDTALDNLG